MAVKKMGGVVALFYAAIPVIIGFLSTSAEQGLINAAVAATVVAALQCAIRVMDIQGWGQLSNARDDFELMGNVTPAGVPAPKNGGRSASFLWRVVIGE